MAKPAHDFGYELPPPAQKLKRPPSERPVPWHRPGQRLIDQVRDQAEILRHRELGLRHPVRDHGPLDPRHPEQDTTGRPERPRLTRGESGWRHLARVRKIPLVRRERARVDLHSEPVEREPPLIRHCHTTTSVTIREPSSAPRTNSTINGSVEAGTDILIPCARRWDRKMGKTSTRASAVRPDAEKLPASGVTRSAPLGEPAGRRPQRATKSRTSAASLRVAAIVPVPDLSLNPLAGSAAVEGSDVSRPTA
ncbi:hypothetical protein [Micromonospora globbae]|uniref:hypothetical protein n=1 Tax=Micromonospora globbae TaxID=1894969 RepID=UPI00343E8CD2